MDRKEFTYRGCVIRPERLERPMYVACDEVNRYTRLVWVIDFPDETWIRVGTKKAARSYIDTHTYHLL